MNANELVGVKRRLSRAEAERLVSEFEQSGLKRKEFCATRGLNVFTLDAWRKRIAQSQGQEKIVPVEIVEEDGGPRGAMQSAVAGRGGQFRVVLSQGLRIEVDPGFDAAELRRLIAVLDVVESRSSSARSV